MRFHRALLVFAVALLASTGAYAQAKVGFVNIERVMREAAPAVKAAKKLQKEFDKRAQDLEKLDKQLQTGQDNFEKNSVTMSDAERRAKERELSDMNREYTRRKREFQEDVNQRRNEELAGLQERAVKAVREIAEAEKYDVILLDALYVSPSVDLTEKVIKALSADK